MYRDRSGEFVCGYWGLKGQQPIIKAFLQSALNNKPDAWLFTNLPYQQGTSYFP